MPEQHELFNAALNNEVKDLSYENAQIIKDSVTELFSENGQNFQTMSRKLNIYLTNKVVGTAINVGYKWPSLALG